MWIKKVYIVCMLSSCMLVSSAIHQTLEKSGPEEINVRLASVGSGVQSAVGRVEIQDASNSSNPFGTVCDDQWDNKAASVACRQLGYKWGEKLMLRSQSGSVSMNMDEVPIFLDEVQCEGHEKSLLDCVHSGWSNHDCSHTEGAGAICHNETVRLNAPIDDNSIGNVQIMHKYKWAEVCDANWNNISARLVCQYLGFTDGIAQCYSAIAAASFANLVNVTFNCSANDTSFDTCRNETFFDRTECALYHRASVICYNSTFEDVNTSKLLCIS